jgi:hypothetical protein
MSRVVRKPSQKSSRQISRPGCPHAIVRRAPTRPSRWSIGGPSHCTVSWWAQACPFPSLQAATAAHLSAPAWSPRACSRYHRLETRTAPTLRDHPPAAPGRRSRAGQGMHALPRCASGCGCRTQCRFACFPRPRLPAGWTRSTSPTRCASRPETKARGSRTSRPPCVHAGCPAWLLYGCCLAQLPSRDGSGLAAEHVA